MIKFKDFRDDRKTFDRGVEQATIDMNKWILNRQIEVISIETILNVKGNMISTLDAFEAIRLWYKELS
ncbi:hypothetical protein BB12_24910 [Salmonella enterica subsp. diarizonae]|uniref:Uncharacterized protein n=3 Tax=Salmonella enterica TaxID=28901 RepID=A0A3R0QE20_SALEN|nr:hypothetical protein [Salmonella enterica]AXC70093.1 hypothetical protein DOE63_33030 [Salmonella enterica subsp. diarizonae serovar 59:z10:-]EBP4184109.1 hypothetical protein [Salmonella enterica subsp. diarizonae]EBQ9004918.1 hypothetical protein [Salmonella enterica subsp. enterica serovar Blockley]EBS5461115.1 hypothetical protein [Salmonella enterica subsp. enterica serovar Enteritidis]EBS5544329.1 hypothetical protein [Salmonella enterica subsp. enterica serovar Plymouth]ECA1251904.1